MSDPRTLRQRLVAEIGEAGQAKIGAARARVAGTGLAAEVERRYLEGAAFGVVEAAPDATAPIPTIAASLDAIGGDESAQDVILGAARALAQIRVAAGLDGG
jgi:hypothetical protein